MLWAYTYFTWVVFVLSKCDKVIFKLQFLHIKNFILSHMVILIKRMLHFLSVITNTQKSPLISVYISVFWLKIKLCFAYQHTRTDLELKKTFGHLGIGDELSEHLNVVWYSYKTSSWNRARKQGQNGGKTHLQSVCGDNVWAILVFSTHC